MDIISSMSAYKIILKYKIPWVTNVFCVVLLDDLEQSFSKI